MHWYLIHTKPRQEKSALENLERQGYECYLPRLPTERICQGILALTDEPLFPRYLFIRLGEGESDKSWAPIRSTRGVSRLVTFGMAPARVDGALIQQLRIQEAAVKDEPQRLFHPGERVLLTDSPFTDIEGIFQIAEGESRVMVLIELLSRPIAVCVPPASLRKVI